MLKIVRVDFPLLDKPGKVKNRPALCLTPPSGKYNLVIIAPITSKVAASIANDVVLDVSDAQFTSTGLSKSSVIQLHKMVSVAEKRLQGEVGSLTPLLDDAVRNKLRALFQL